MREESNVKTCISCNRQLEDDAIFCPKSREKQPEKAVETEKPIPVKKTTAKHGFLVILQKRKLPLEAALPLLCPILRGNQSRGQFYTVSLAGCMLFTMPYAILLNEAGKLLTKTSCNDISR